ncbi:MAG: sugar phosphate isomerase/epimerase [Planctomycetaceae bacterium]|nr:sugar phosphate isomerase/epimerase [Planctomycetaceae bacterium]
MKTAVSSYSFSQYLGRGKDLLWAVETAAELGFEGMEFTGLGGEAPEDLAAGVKDACAAFGLPIVSYTVGANLLDNTPAAVEGVKRELQIAAILGAPVLRHDAAWRGPDQSKSEAEFDAVLPALADACRQITQFAAELNIRTCVENHGYFVQDSIRCEKLARAVADPNFGWLIDIGNFLCADDDPVAATRRMAPFAVHVHAKDFRVTSAAASAGKGGLRSRGGALLEGTAVGEGSVDVRGCVAAIEAAGYNGFISIEYEGSDDCLKGLAAGLKNLRAAYGLRQP